MMKYICSRKGVTLIELIVVMTIVIIIAGVAVYALNPARHFAQARNTQRWSHVYSIVNGVYQRMTDNRGVWNSTCGSVTANLPAATTTIGSDPAFINLDACLNPTYLPTFPLDPVVGAATNTGYTIIKYASGRINVSAPFAEVGDVISVTR